MIVTATAGKIDAAIGRFEGPLMAYMLKEEQDFAKDSIKEKLYNVRKSKHYSESVSGLTGIGGFVPTDGAIPYTEFEEGYDKTFTHQVWKLGIEIKRELLDDSRVLDMEALAGMLTDSWNTTLEEMLHAPFNNCTATTFTFEGKSFNNAGADDLALASNAHTSKTGKGSSQDNYTTNTLTVANLKTAEEMMKGFKTDIGKKGNWKGDTLLVPYESRDAAWEIAYSAGKVNSGDNNVNPYKEKFNVVVSDWLTDTDAWFN
ncbi:MAG: Mu-like prophage major head subunit gpT family protein [Candidatus Saccharibacteria bacterium]